MSLQSEMQAIIINNKAPAYLKKFAKPKAKSLDSSYVFSWGQYGLEIADIYIDWMKKWIVI